MNHSGKWWFAGADFPLQLGLASGVDQRLAALKLQFGDLGGAQAKALGWRVES